MRARAMCTCIGVSMWISFVLHVRMCTCMYTFIYSNTYMYKHIMHKRTSRYNSSGRGNEVVPHRYWTSVHHVDYSHQKTRMPLFLPRVTPIPIYFHPVYFHSLRSYTRLYPISSLRVTFSHSETRVFISLYIPQYTVLLFSISFFL